MAAASRQTELQEGQMELEEGEGAAGE
uniref:Uncharacterized protein n=1 Tax=Moniliophthora roreri TaxID=221103 RepID=A0A0W0G021_MONRR